MKGVYVIAEHRQGKIIESTYEGITCGEKIAEELGCEVSVVLLSGGGTVVKKFCVFV